MTKNEVTPIDLATLTDDHLLGAYEAIGGDAGDRETERQIAEIQRRGLNV